MNHKRLLDLLEGIQTISSIMTLLNVNRSKAIYYVYRLRRQGYIKTKRLSNNERVYEISYQNKLKGISYYDIINSNSPIKIQESSIYRIYGKTPSIEETIIFAIKTKSIRTILASIALYGKIKNWNELYILSKSNHVERQVGALYDLSRLYIKTRRLPLKIRKNMLPKAETTYQFMIDNIKSEDFQNLECIWKIYIPFNAKDLEEYK